MKNIKHVDDIFAIVKENCIIENFIKELNSIDKNIKFTFENENNRRLNYLDIKITRTEDNIFETTVYRKPGSSKEIINTRCRIPCSYKIASLRS